MRTSVPGYSVRSVLVAFAFAVSIPLVLLLGMLLLRSASTERAELERRLLQVASNLAELIDRDIDRSIALLQTLATSPAITTRQWETFHTQAKAALAGKAYLVLVDATGRQIVNTYVAFGKEPPFTGDPESVKRVLESKGPVVSNMFVSLVVEQPVYNISIPVSRDGGVDYVLSLGLLPADLALTLQKLVLNPSWITTIWDRQGVVLAQSRDHNRFLAQRLPDALRRTEGVDRTVHRARNMDGEDILLATATSRLSGWGISVSVPETLAEATLRSSMWLWGWAAAATLLITSLLGFLFGKVLVNSLSALTLAARMPLGHRLGELPLSHVREVNEVSGILYSARERQDLLLREVSHRSKNMLAVVQALITQTLRGNLRDTDRQQLLIERLHALARAHDALVAGNWAGIEVRDIVQSELAAFQDRATITGPSVLIKPDVVESLTLVLHELVTNAIKYGALSNDAGRIDVGWQLTPTVNGSIFKFEWREQGGPEVKEPERRGLGMRLLRRALSGATSDVVFSPDGLVYTLEVRLSAIVVDATISAS